jgi:hypothetical protein
MGKIQLEVSKNEAAELLEFYMLRRAKLLSEHAEVFNKMNEYSTQINNLRKLIHNDRDNYPLSGSWNQKIQFVLRDQLDGLTARDIAAKISDLEKIRNPEEAKRVYNSVSPTLSTGTGPIYDRKTNALGEYVYLVRN